MKRLDLSSCARSIRIAKAASLRQIGREVKTAIAGEFKLNNKAGVPNKRNQYAGRRSSISQSLAKDSGQALANLNSSIEGNKVVIGIRKFTNTLNGGKNYIQGWEDSGSRPTIANALEKTRDRIYSIVRTNKNSKL